VEERGNVSTKTAGEKGLMLALKRSGEFKSRLPVEKS
jgi:hypothetical protein